MRKNQTVLNSEKDLNIRTGIILSIYKNINRATVQLDSGPTLNKIQFYYHCSPDDVENGSSAFYIDDEVLIANSDGVDYIIGFKDLKPRSCLGARFFVKINKGDGFEYYWLNLLDEEGNYDLTTIEATGTNLLELMLDTPYNNEHIATKAFILKNKDDINERWVAAPHLLTKDRAQQFLPLYYPATEILCPPFPSPKYPLPASCFLFGSGSPGLDHPCPPDRFYCNTDENIMAWYSVYTVDNPVPPAGKEALIFGIIYDIHDEEIKVTYFSYSSRDLEYLGLQGYWFYKGTTEDVLCLESEVPVNMLADIEVLNKEQRKIVIPWSSRPILITHNFDGSGTTYEERNSANHWLWDDSPEGFKQELFAEMTQELKEDDSEYQEDSCSNPQTTCSEYENEAACEADHGHAKEYLANRYQSIEFTIDKSSEYNLYLFNVTTKTKSYQKHIDIYEYRYESWTHCVWDYGPQNCRGPLLNGAASKRFIVNNLKQKEVDSRTASWESPNVIQIFSKIDRIYTSALGHQGPAWPERGWGGENQSDFLDFCVWQGISEDQQWAVDLFTCAKCFYGYPMPGDEWSGIDNDWTYPTTDGWMWKRTTEKDDYTATPVNELQIDGVIVLDSSKWDRTYYLDDRSTEDAHGIIVAAKDYKPETEHSPEEIYDWEIHWTKAGVNYIDITADVLAVLGIEKEQLYEIGLI